MTYYISPPSEIVGGHLHHVPHLIAPDDWHKYDFPMYDVNKQAFYVQGNKRLTSSKTNHFSEFPYTESNNQQLPQQP